MSISSGHLRHRAEEHRQHVAAGEQRERDDTSALDQRGEQDRGLRDRADPAGAPGTRIAQMSWNTSMPSVMRPGSGVELAICRTAA